jgi:hypothetical protein
MAITRPTNLTKPFADSAGAGYVRTVPEPSQISITPGAASLTDGFPPLNFLDSTAGGVPMSGQDLNGILKILSQHIAFAGSGGKYRFDAALSTAIGGYPVGTVLQNDAGTQEYINNTAGNTTNFNSTPSSIGVTWMPHAGVKQRMIVQQQETNGIGAGNTAVGAVTVALNTVVFNSIVGASLASNQITLPIGSYIIKVRQTLRGLQDAKAWLRNITAGNTVIGIGTGSDTTDASSGAGGGIINGYSDILAYVTLTATSAIDVRVTADAIVTNGLGRPSLVTTLAEIYGVVDIEKIA